MNSNYLSQDNGCTLQTSKSKEENYLEGAVIDSEQWIVKRLHKQNKIWNRRKMVTTLNFAG